MRARAGARRGAIRLSGWRRRLAGALLWLACVGVAPVGCGVVSAGAPETTMTLTAASLTAEPVSDFDLDKAADMMLARIKAAGLEGSVEVQPGRTVVVRVSGSYTLDELAPLAGRGEVRFRPVLAAAPDASSASSSPAGSAGPAESGGTAVDGSSASPAGGGATNGPAASNGPTVPNGSVASEGLVVSEGLVADGSAAASDGSVASNGSAGPDGSAASGGQANPVTASGSTAPDGPGTLGGSTPPGGSTASGGSTAPGGLAGPAAEDSPAANGSTSHPGPVTPGGAAGSGAGRNGGYGAGGPSLETVRYSLGAAYRVAETLTDPGAVRAEQRSALAAFAALSGAEVAVLPATMQFAVPTVSCRQLAARPVQAITAADRAVVVCDERNKYLLGPAGVTGDDIAGASVERDGPEREPQVIVTFTTTGQLRWTAMTREAVAARKRDGAVHQVAIVLDGAVFAVPDVRQIIMSGAVISGLPPRGVGRTAALLRHGPLPVSFSVRAFSTG